MGENHLIPVADLLIDEHDLASSDRGVDRASYLQIYPDVAEAGADPVEHYLRHGWHEGRDPRADFSTSGYVEANKDVEGNPLVHYLRHGGTKVAPREWQFAADYDLASNAGGVDGAWYLQIYPDVAEAGADPVEHYLRHGWHEGRDPRADFSTSGYLEANKDIEGNPLVHYLRHGGTKVAPPEWQFAADYDLASSAGGVDRAWYLQTYPDVAEAGADPVEHYLRHGCHERRDPRADFSTSGYLEANKDVEVNPLIHYLRHLAELHSEETAVTDWYLFWKKGFFYPRGGQQLRSNVPFGMPGTPKILFTGHEASRTGAPLILLRLMEAFQSLTGAELYLILERGGPLLDDYARIAHVFVNHNGALCLPNDTVLARMLQSVAAPAPTLAICNCADGWRLVKALRDAGLPHVVSLIHERVVHYSPDVWHTIHQNSDRVILPAQAVKAATTAVLPDFQDALVVPQGLLRSEFGRGDRNAARVAVRNKLGLSLDTAIILGCGTQGMRKGVDLFIQLAARVRARSRRDVHFLWLGAEQNYGLFTRLIELDISQLDLSSTVSLLGEITDPEPYFLAADAFALTSRDDPFPCAIQEAMACALPIITFEGSGGAKEALSGGSGMVVPYMDIDAMATSLTSVIEAPSRYAGMAERARSRVRSVYKFSEYAERIKQVCDVVTGKRAPDQAADAHRSTAQKRQDQEEPNPFAAGKKWFQEFLGNVSRAIRVEQWWSHKLVPMFAVFYATAYVHQAPVATVWRAAVALLLAIAPCAAYVSIVNDVTDRADDRRAGKANRMAGRPVWQIVLLLAAPLCVAVFFTVLWRDDIPLAVSYLGAWVAFSLYSIPPFRLKTRGIFGVIADACGSHVFPTLTAALLALRAIETAIDPGWIWALALWAFGCGLRGILWHQLYDEAADRATAVRTFVVRHSRESALRLARVALLFELVGLGLLLWRADNPWQLVPLLVYVLFISAKSRLWHLEIVLAEPRGQYAILGQEYYTFLFPLGFLLFCALHSPLDWAVLAGHVVVFPRPAASFINEARELLSSALRRVRLHAGTHGALPAAGAASAGAARRGDSAPTVSATVTAPTLDVAITRAAAFLRERLRSGSYALAAIGSDGTPRFPDDKGHLFVASFMAEAMNGLFDEVDRTIILARILCEEQNEAWGYQSPGMLYNDDTRPFLVDSDDSAFVIRTLHRLGVNREPRGLMRFYRESERLFVTWDKGTHTPVSLSTEPSLQNNFLAHPEVNANIFLALRDTHFEKYVNYDVLLQAQDARGFWKSYFYPTPLYATLLVLDLTQGNAAFAAARERALSFIAESQNADGSWGTGGDPYETALAVAALARQGAHAEATQRGVAFLLSTIADDGSWTSEACIWESYWTEDDLWRGYDRHRAYITSRCLTALRRAAADSWCVNDIKSSAVRTLL